MRIILKKTISPEFIAGNVIKAERQRMRPLVRQGLGLADTNL